MYSVMNKAAIASILFLATASHADAISRYNSTSLSCSKAKSIVSQQGAVVYRYPSSRNASLVLYDRFVASGSHCAFGEIAARKAIPTASGKCTLLACRPSTRGGIRRRGDSGGGSFCSGSSIAGTTCQ